MARRRISEAETRKELIILQFEKEVDEIVSFAKKLSAQSESAWISNH